jgi:hypothetical protein
MEAHPMQAVAHGDNKVLSDLDALPGTRVALSDRTSPAVASQPEGDTHLEAAFHLLMRPRAPGEQLTEMDHEAATLVLKAYWPKFVAPRPLPERWR